MMNGRKGILPQLPTISAVAAYLQSRGWTKVMPPDPDRANPNVLIYQGGSDLEGKPLTAALPAHSDLIDAKRCLSNVVHLLAILEAKPSRQMAREIIARESATDVAAVGTSPRTARRNGKRPDKAVNTSA